MMDGRSIASSPLSHSAALIKAPQAASAEYAFSSTLTHVCCLNGRKAETERNRHGWCWYSYTCVSVYSCVYLSVIRATHEKVEAAWLPELHTAFTHFAHSYDPLMLQCWSMAGSVQNTSFQEAFSRITHLRFTFFSVFDYKWNWPKYVFFIIIIIWIETAEYSMTRHGFSGYFRV